MNSLKYLLIGPDFKTLVPQAFACRHSIIHYLIKNSTVKVLKKLHLCCKYFFVHGKIALFKNMKISSDISKPYDSNGDLCLPSSNDKLNLFYIVFLNGKLVCDGAPYCPGAPFHYTYKSSNNKINLIRKVPLNVQLVCEEAPYRIERSPSVLSSVISNNLYHCEAEYIDITGQDLTASELKFLLSSKTKRVEMKYCRISLLETDIHGFVKRYANQAEFGYVSIHFNITNRNKITHGQD
uniref:Uncharacterized protein n=1 Tax=Panagrolaimus davidi TaxID=227884 RepID=A0A914P797_9BILA